MAEYEQQDNSGAIFKNDKKGNEKAPDYKGKGVIDGVAKEFALWLKTSKAGKPYMSIAFSEPYNKDGASTPQAGSDDAPF